MSHFTSIRTASPFSSLFVWIREIGLLFDVLPVAIMVPVFLVHFTATGEELLTELPYHGDAVTYFLPDEAPSDRVTLASAADQQRSVCLGWHFSFTPLSWTNRNP